MNSLRNYIALPLLSLLPVTVAADTSYDAIRKDINVMNRIVAVAIDSADDCERCRASLKGSYLADQGALFVVSPRRAGLHEMITADGNYAIESLEELEGLEELEELHALESLEGLPQMIGEIVADVEVSVSGITADGSDADDHDIRITRHQIVRDEHRDTERKLRTLQRNLRRLSEDLRDKELEAFQAEESDRAQIDTALREIENQISSFEKEQNDLRQQLADARQERNREREKRRAEAAARTQARNSRIENIVITAFCDYGASLKSLPENQKVTILFENNGSQWSAEKSRIYVMNKSDLSACQKGKINRDTLAEGATIYQF